MLIYCHNIWRNHLYLFVAIWTNRIVLLQIGDFLDLELTRVVSLALVPIVRERRSLAWQCSKVSCDVKKLLVVRELSVVEARHASHSLWVKFTVGSGPTCFGFPEAVVPSQSANNVHLMVPGVWNADHRTNMRSSEARGPLKSRSSLICVEALNTIVMVGSFSGSTPICVVWLNKSLLAGPRLQHAAVSRLSAIVWPCSIPLCGW